MTDKPKPFSAVDQNGAVAAALLSVVNAVREYLPPDGISKDEFVNRVIGAVDNPQINPFIRGLEDGRS